jgi:hypothetical protein
MDGIQPIPLAKSTASTGRTGKTGHARVGAGPAQAYRPRFVAAVFIWEQMTPVQKAAPLIQSAAEKKLFLGTLGTVGNAGTLQTIVPYLDDAAAKEEACAAVVTIADKLLKNRRNAERVAPRLVEPLQRVTQTTGNADLAKRAQALLEQAKKVGVQRQ